MAARKSQSATTLKHSELEQKLDRLYDRLLQAQSISTLATDLASEIEDHGGLSSAQEAVTLRSTLEHLTEMLGAIKDRSSPDEILRGATREVGHG